MMDSGAIAHISKEDETKLDKRTRAQTLGVIGTGDFGQALAKRLVYSGYDVIVGSRRPESRRVDLPQSCLCGVQVKSVAECIDECSIVFIAIPVANFKETLHSHTSRFKGKIVIDVSNRDAQSSGVSNAEYLSMILPESYVVKAFNVISAYVMENDVAGGSRSVFIASDAVDAREKVCSIARDMGFTPVDFGRLPSARRIETFVLHLFPGWKVPIAFSVGVFIVWFLYAVYPYFGKRVMSHWHNILMRFPNKAICMTAITIMALTYMPGCLAGFLQMAYGTKRRRFPNWMDVWLKSRKQLGVIAFVYVCIHVLISLMLISPAYYCSWYEPSDTSISCNSSVPLNTRSVMTWKGEGASLAGILAFVTMFFLAVTTLPSVADTLNWREWRAVQSYLGYFTLLLSTAHVFILGISYWSRAGFVKTLRSKTFLSTMLPAIVICMKIILMLPCVNSYVTKIRRGWERNSNPCLSCNTRPSCGRKKDRSGNSCGCGCVSGRQFKMAQVFTVNTNQSPV